MGSSTDMYEVATPCQHTELKILATSNLCFLHDHPDGRVSRHDDLFHFVPCREAFIQQGIHTADLLRLSDIPHHRHRRAN